MLSSCQGKMQAVVEGRGNLVQAATSMALYHASGGQTQTLACGNRTSNSHPSLLPCPRPLQPSRMLHSSATREANLLLAYPNPNIHPCQRHILVQPSGEQSLCTWKRRAFPSPPLTCAAKGSRTHVAACTASSLLFDHRLAWLRSQPDQTPLLKGNGITCIRTQQSGTSSHQSSIFTLLLSTLSFRFSYSRCSGAGPAAFSFVCATPNISEKLLTTAEQIRKAKLAMKH